MKLFLRDTNFHRLPKTRSCDNLPTACESSTSTTQNHSCSDPNLNDRRVSLDITMTTESDRNSSDYSAEDSETTLDNTISRMETLDGRLPGNSTEGAELSVETEVIDSLMDLQKNTPAFRHPEEDSVDSSSSDSSNVNAEDLKHGSVTCTVCPASSQQLLDTRDHPEINSTSTNTPNHDLSQSNNRSLSENSREKPQTPDDICSPDDRQTTAAGDASLMPPHKSSTGVLERGPVATQRLTASGRMDKDGLSLNGDAVQVRLRQMETGNGLQVDMLKLKKLWSHLHVNGKLVSHKQIYIY